MDSTCRARLDKRFLTNHDLLSVPSGGTGLAREARRRACRRKAKVIAVPDPLRSPVVLDGIVSDEKLSDLLGLGTEYAELDYKSSLDLDDKRQLLELVKDVAAMEVRGGYILGGVGPDGKPTGDLDGGDLKVFDEARLVPKLRRWLPEPLKLVTRVTERQGHRTVVIYVERHPAGLVFIERDGTYSENGKEKFLFRKGEVFWRDGTRSVRLGQRGFEEVIEGRVDEAKDTWMDEQREIRRREQMEYEAASKGSGPLGSVNFDLDRAGLNAGALELVRRDDNIALRHLFNEALARARSLIDRGELDPELNDLLDRLICLAATFLSYGQDDSLADVFGVLTQIYSMPLQQGDAQRFAYSSAINPSELAPRIWLQIIERVYALGSLAVRKENWEAVRMLTLQQPQKIDTYERNWLRHTITMASRAQHFQERKQGQTIEVSLLMLARADAARLDCLRSDGIGPNDDELIASLAEFDALSNIVAIDGAGEAAGRYFYPNFARFESHRVIPIVERLLRDPEMREILFTRSDSQLAQALAVIGHFAEQEGMRFFGFAGWDDYISKFISENGPPTSIKP
jgi:hypothetical protein